MTPSLQNQPCSGIIKNSDVPERLIDYSKTWNVSLECIWNITVTPGWKVSNHGFWISGKFVHLHLYPY